MTSHPILDRLNGRVVAFTEQPDGSFVAEEQCDRCYFEELTRDEMLQLADEIRDLATVRVPVT